MLQPVRPVHRAERRRRAVLGHLCPKCHELWALSAVQNDNGFVVVCRHCDYQRPVLVLPRQSLAGVSD